MRTKLETAVHSIVAALCSHQPLVRYVAVVVIPCTRMIDAVWKLSIFVSMLYRITKTSRNERVTLRVYNTYPTNVRRVHSWSHGTHPGGSLIRKLQNTKRSLLRSRHFLFVTSLTERGGSGIAHAIKA
jgi:hypothetical protein